MTLLVIYAFGAFWTSAASAGATTSWRDPLQVSLFVFSVAMWPIFWLLVIAGILAGRIK